LRFESDAMKADEQLIRQLFPNASRSLIEANTRDPELPFDEKREGGETANNALLRPKLERHNEPRTVGKAKAQKGDSRRFLVRVTSIRRRLLDEDNLCEKYVIDCCRYAGLLPGDSPGETKIEVTQQKAATKEAECTVIQIFEVAPADEEDF
jgi:hypothetical protein